MLIKFIFLIVFIQLVVTHVVYNKKTITVKPVKPLIINRPLNGSVKMYANKPLYRIPSFTCNRMNCQMFCFDSKISETKSCFIPKMFEQKCCFAPKIIKQKDCFAHRMPVQKHKKKKSV